MSSKAQSIVSYLGLFWFLAYIFGNAERTGFSVYHLRQGLGLLVTGFFFVITSLTLSLFFSEMKILTSVVPLIQLLLSVFGIIHVINQVEKPIPVIGKIFEKQFNFIK